MNRPPVFTVPALILPTLTLPALIAALATTACKGGDIEPATRPAGSEETTKTAALEVGAKVLQDPEPTQTLDIYLVGFHPMKDDPHHQMEAHHYCRQVNEEFAQCALYDANTADANLNGIEYIISERLFDALPEEEKQYWHPHNFEILSGALIAPGLPDAAEEALMKGKMNSYGKTWHTWSSRPFGGTGDRLPLGKAMLAWSFNAHGEALPGLIKRRDNAMHIESAEIGRERAALQSLAKPQRGVHALGAAFPTRRVPPYVQAKDDGMAPDGTGAAGAGAGDAGADIDGRPAGAGTGSPTGGSFRGTDGRQPPPDGRLLPPNGTTPPAEGTPQPVTVPPRP